MRARRGDPADDAWCPFELASGVLAAFTSRHGGVSDPPFDSLNLGGVTGDDPAAVVRNRRLVARACSRPADGMAPGRKEAASTTAGGIAWMRQVHGADVAYVAAGTNPVAGSPGPAASGPDPGTAGPGPGTAGPGPAASGPAPGTGGPGPAAGSFPAAAAALPQAPEVDAIFTDVPGLPLGVLVADCAPVLIADPQARIVGAAHAGREGMAGGVVPALVRAMVRAGADAARLRAAIGPAICGGCYEVPVQLRERIAGVVPEAGCVTRKGSPGIDISAGVAAQLARAGLQAVSCDPRCTAETAALYSYRRDGRTGRFAGLVWLAS